MAEHLRAPPTDEHATTFEPIGADVVSGTDGDGPGHLDACFLGPYGENDDLLEKLVVEFLRDHVYWRRNIHPEDPPVIPTRAARTPGYQAMEARMRRELHLLSAALKRSVPVHSPRYIGHMVSDLLLPGLAAQLLTLPYNPNNVCTSAAPVTIELERRAGLQLARMLGFPADPSRPDCAYGHLTSGGTVANLQALRLALALKAFPVALRAAAVPGLHAGDDDWAAFNQPVDDAIALLGRWHGFLASLPATERAHWRGAVAAERIEQLGLLGFFARHPTLSPPRVLAPASAHYSWSKGMKLLGLGREQLVLLPLRDLRLDPVALEAAYTECASKRIPVLLTVAVLGTTEFGSIDPVDAAIATRDRWNARGLASAVHVDAAWGGYLATLFRSPDGSLRAEHEVAREFIRFPRPGVHAAFAAVARADSVTVDPHKLGYLPYGSGAFIARDQRALPLLAECADYVFAGDEAEAALPGEPGPYLIEGSKPGANAAAVYVTHQVIPLDHRHFGRLQAQSLRHAEAFHARALQFIAEIAPLARVAVPFAPDTNLLCLALNPAGNSDPARAAALVQAIHAALSCDPAQPVQRNEFFGSTTTLHAGLVGAATMDSVYGALGLLRSGSDDSLPVLRHTLMNPWLIDRENGISYIELYFQHLGQLIAAACAAQAA